MALTTPARLSLHCSGELPAPGSRWRDHSSSKSCTGSGQAECLPARRVELSTLGQHPSHQLPLLQTHIHPSHLCSDRKGKIPVCWCQDTSWGQSHNASDRPHDLGLNPHLDQPACRQARTLVPFQDHCYDAGISHQPEHLAPSKAGGTKSHHPLQLCAWQHAGGRQQSLSITSKWLPPHLRWQYLPQIYCPMQRSADRC